MCLVIRVSFFLTITKWSLRRALHASSTRTNDTCHCPQLGVTYLTSDPISATSRDHPHLFVNLHFLHSGYCKFDFTLNLLKIRRSLKRKHPRTDCIEYNYLRERELCELPILYPGNERQIIPLSFRRKSVLSLDTCIYNRNGNRGFDKSENVFKSKSPVCSVLDRFFRPFSIHESTFQYSTCDQ